VAGTDDGGVTDETDQTAEQFWEGFYQDRDAIWSGRPNPLLVREVTDLTPGTALDLGCGEGADAVWLARRGWRVTAMDISATALGRGAGHAETAGVGDRIEWVRHDLAASAPGGAYDLVSAQFLQSPIAGQGEWESILRGAADAVAPGGTVVIVAHAGWPSFVDTPPHDYRFPTMPEILAALGLPKPGWTVALTELVEREIEHDGNHGVRGDNLVRAVRAR
jgi:SAM-dependent methyltransferase